MNGALCLDYLRAMTHNPGIWQSTLYMQSGTSLYQVVILFDGVSNAKYVTSRKRCPGGHRETF